MVFKVKFSTFVKVITIIVTAMIIYAISQLVATRDLGNVLIAVALVVIVGYFALQTPLKIALDDSGFTLYKVIGKKRVDFTEISDIKLFNASGTDLRLLGSGGFLGYYGKFSNNEIGSYMSYVGNFKQAFLVTTKQGNNLVFSCENVENLIETVRKHINL